jgi:hypothetical protein
VKEQAEHPGQDKQPYEAPRVRRVELVADEMAVTGCKSISVGGNPNLCRRGSVLVNRTIGS